MTRSLSVAVSAWSSASTFPSALGGCAVQLQEGRAVYDAPVCACCACGGVCCVWSVRGRLCSVTQSFLSLRFIDFRIRVGVHQIAQVRHVGTLYSMRANGVTRVVDTVSSFKLLTSNNRRENNAYIHMTV